MKLIVIDNMGFLINYCLSLLVLFVYNDYSTQFIVFIDTESDQPVCSYSFAYETNNTLYSLAPHD